MSEYSTIPQQQPTYVIPPPASPNWKTPAVVGALILLFASNVYLYTQIEHLKTDSKNDMAKLSTDLNQSINQLRMDNSAAVQHSKRTVETLQEQLEKQRVAAAREVGAAKVDAENKVAQLEQKVSAEQQKQQAILSQVKQTADTTSTKLNDVSTDVGTVKTDVAHTKSELETTIASLRRVSGDVDSQGSLIATNGKELAALRALGERNYFEFTIAKAKQPQKVSDITILLKKTDPKKHTYSIIVTADDKAVPKENRGINEPVQFLTLKAKQPYEIVVNEVRKDTIVGYLSTPKVQNGRN
jgi:hypothetical protein